MGPRIRAKETHKPTGRRPVMAVKHGAGEKTQVCVLISCACLYCTKDATIELLGLAGSRPAMKRTHCVAVLHNSNDIVEFMFRHTSYKHSVLQDNKVR